MSAVKLPARIWRTTTRSCSVGPSLHRLLPLPCCSSPADPLLALPCCPSPADPLFPSSSRRLDPELLGFAAFLALPVRFAFEVNSKMMEAPTSHLVMILLLLLLLLLMLMLMTRVNVDFACQSQMHLNSAQH